MASQKPVPLTPSQIAIVKSTAPILQEHGVTITSHFYSTMLSEHPFLHNIFNAANQATGDQPRALANLVFAFASHVDDIPSLTRAVTHVAHKHVSLQVRAEHYPIVGKYLIAAVAHILGPDVVTAEVADAWIAAYAVLADIFISLETSLYDANQNKTPSVWPTPVEEGRAGWRPFRISKRVEETNVDKTNNTQGGGGIASFYLVPVDGGALPTYQPGQYVSVRIPVEQLGGVLQPRQYSLSDAAGTGYLRISVKRETEHAGRPRGLVSNILHDKYREGDVVEVTHPMGDFHLSHDQQGQETEETTTSSTTTAAEAAEAPLVLLSAGVGVTPMIAILNTTINSTTPKRIITWIHGAHSDQALAFHSHIANTATNHQAEMTSHLFLSTTPSPPTTTTTTTSSSTATTKAKEKTATSPNQHIYSGRIDLSIIPSGAGGLFLNNSKTEYYICGPSSFMKDTQEFLVRNKNVDESRVFREIFGTGV